MFFLVDFEKEFNNSLQVLVSTAAKKGEGKHEAEAGTDREPLSKVSDCNTMFL